MTQRILFVCTGNICRSPTAEGVLRHLAAARGLADDAAVLDGFVITHDTIAEGVHFLPSDPPASVGWKLVAVNLSDLAAKGQWKEAVEGYHKAIDKHPDILALQHRLAVAYLKAGDLAGYRQRCKELLEELHGTDNAGAVDVVRACSLAWAGSWAARSGPGTPRTGWVC